MIIKETEYTMKNGRQALIRSPREEDIQGILDYLYQELWSLGIRVEPSDHRWQECYDQIRIHAASRL